MKALIQKEIRENAKLAALGLIIYGLLLLHIYLNYLWDLRSMALGAGPRNAEGWQPLLSEQFVQRTAFFCPILAAVLGWFQIHNERHRDLWGFLVHRPLTRTSIFLSKAMAGLLLFFVGAGVPFLLFVGWAITPGHVAAPFEWSMVLPAAAMFLTAPAYYFAGMLTGLRQARWYASRGVPLASAIVVSICASVAVPHFWQALCVIALGVFILGLAAWGSFHSNGYYEGQPEVSKPASALGLVFGTSLVVLAVFGILTQVFLERWLTSPRTWSHYAMLKDGTIYKQIDRSDRPSEVLDLNGKPLINKKTGLPFEAQEARQQSPTTAGWMMIDFGLPKRQPGYFTQVHRLFVPDGMTSGVLWFYWIAYGRLVAFDIPSRRPIGSLGPDGFAQGTLAGAQFDYTAGTLPQSLNPLGTQTNLYQLNLAERAAKSIFTTKADDPIGGSGVVQGEDERYTIVATKQFVYLLKPTGEVVWKAPYAPGYPDYDRVTVYFLNTNDFAVWFSPTGEVQRRTGTLPEHVTFLADGRSVRTVELPNDRPPFSFDTADKLMSFLAPALLVGLDKCLPEDVGANLPLTALWFSLAGGVLSMVAGWWLSQRYSFAASARAGWMGFLLLFGIPGLLAFLGLQEWPAREPCPNCGRLRVVNRYHCEHCDAEFRPPQLTGTEIFEAVAE